MRLGYWQSNLVGVQVPRSAPDKIWKQPSGEDGRFRFFDQIRRKRHSLFGPAISGGYQSSAVALNAPYPSVNTS